MGLTVNLQKTCVQVLMQCWEFKDKTTLEPLFGIDPLTKYSTALPLEARSRVHLVELVIHNLVTYPALKGEPLLDLLVVLRDKRDEAAAERKELDELFKQISFYLSSIANESERTPGDLDQKKSESKEFRAAIGNYELGVKGETNSGQLETDAAMWIADVYDQPGEWAFRVALAVFNGAPWDTCIEAALDLGNRLPPATPEAVASESAQSPRPPFLIANPLKSLKAAGGELLNSGAFRLVRLLRPDLARAALDYVWDEYTRREVLIDWLTELIVSRNGVKRVRAAIASGLLMLTNFDSMQRAMISKWTHTDDDRRYRVGLGQALGVVAEEGTRISEVRSLLKSWAASTDQSRRWAAARAYIYVGARCPIDEVIRQWRLIADAEEIQTQTVSLGPFSWVLLNPLHLSLLDAMEKFFLAASDMPEVRQTVFAEGFIEFKKWADSSRSDDVEEDDGFVNSTRLGFGLLMVIKLARVLIPTEGEGSVPILLTLLDSAGTPATYRQCLLDIFEQMLVDPAAQPTALDLLRVWVEASEGDSQYEQPMRELLSGLLARETVRGVVRRLVASQLGLWSPLSRFRLREPNSSLTHLRRVIIVVDASDSALPFWFETKSTAFEIGAALPADVEPEVYFLNSDHAQTLSLLAESKSDLLGSPPTRCSLLAPVMRHLIADRRQVDALIVIGSGPVFDLADWLGDPLIDRWVFVRSGPDSLIMDESKDVEEVMSDSSSIIYDRLCDPVLAKAIRTVEKTPMVTLSAQWRIDRCGYPMIFAEPINSYLHLFPVTKAQFERFLGTGPSTWGDEEYSEVLRVNPRVSYRAKAKGRYEGLFLTGIKPLEAKAFAGWLGNEYELPREPQWLDCYKWLEQEPMRDPPTGLAEDALAVWCSVVTNQSPRTMLDLSLMREGVREWVALQDKKESYGGLGCPTKYFPTLHRDPLKLVTVNSNSGRGLPYGFRLISR